MMHSPDPLVDLREQFRAAAAREMAAQAPTRRPRFVRTRARVVALMVALAAGTAGVATAVNLIAIGPDKPDVAPRPPGVAPPPEGPTVDLRVEDPGGELPWGVAVYTSAAGQRCVIAGHLRGSALGLIESGQFRPYAPGTAGSCGEDIDGDFTADVRRIDGRALIYGRARSKITAMTAVLDGERREVRTGPGGAFLFVYDASIDDSKIQLVPQTG